MSFFEKNGLPLYSYLILYTQEMNQNAMKRRVNKWILEQRAPAAEKE